MPFPFQIVDLFSPSAAYLPSQRARLRLASKIEAPTYVAGDNSVGNVVSRYPCESVVIRLKYSLVQIQNLNWPTGTVPWSSMTS